MSRAQEIRLKRLVERCNNDNSRLLEAKKSKKDMKRNIMEATFSHENSYKEKE